MANKRPNPNEVFPNPNLPRLCFIKNVVKNPRIKMTIDTTNMCSHLQHKLFEEDGIYHSLWIAMQDDAELTAVVRSRQLHIFVTERRYLYWQVSLHQKSSGKIEFANCYQYDRSVLRELWKQ